MRSAVALLLTPESPVGYFHANELADDTELSPLAISIGSKISKQFAGAFVLLVSPQPSLNRCS